MGDLDIPKMVYSIIKYGIIFGISLSLFILLVGSLLVHDTFYITKNPKFFITETLMMGIFTSIPIAYMCYMRGAPLSAALTDFGLFFFKIIILHLGFQLCGIYSVLFPKSSNLE